MTEAPAGVVSAIERGAWRRQTRHAAGAMTWRIWGEGPPVVLLHGTFGSWTHWIRNIQPLATHFTVLAPDMPGFGASDTLPEPHTAERLADALAEGLDALVPAPAELSIAGFSFGGIIGGLVAARLGSRVRTVVLVGAGGLAVPFPPLPPLVRVAAGGSDDDVRRAHAENLRRLMFADPEAVDDLAVHVQAENVRLSRFKAGSIPTSDVLQRALPSVKARLAGIWGAGDAFTSPHVEERRELLASFCPALDFRVVDGAGHWVIYEASEAVNSALLDMLRW